MKGDDVMNIRFLKVMAIVIAFLFVTGCAVFVRDDDEYHHHHRDRHWHGSLQQSPQSPVYGLTDDMQSGTG